MNLYVRYFDNETLVSNVDEALDFLASIPEIQLEQNLIDDIKSYAENDQVYPKRYKIRPRVYFIIIKTKAETLEEFKANKKPMSNMAAAPETTGKKEVKVGILSVENEGWYKSGITFKRVIPIPGTAKFQYQDTFFSAYIRATSGLECYDKMVNYLKNRQDVDLRSQFPSAKGNNFMFTYIGNPTASAIEE